MVEKSEFPLIDAAVTLITRGEHVLAVYNPRWGSFTLPMTKRRRWHDPNPNLTGGDREEEWADAAARAAAEWLGRTCTPEFLLDDDGEFQQSDRDGAWKRYHFQCFRVALAENKPLVAGAVAEWLTPEEFFNRRPVSPTARYVVGKLRENGSL